MKLTIRIVMASLACCGMLGLSHLSPVAADDAAESAKPKAESKDNKDDKQWQSLFDGKELGDFAETEFGTGGEVLVKDGNLVLSFGDGCTGVTWTKEFPKVDYEVRLQGQRVQGVDFFCGMTFPVEESSCSLVMGGWGGAVVGLSAVDGNLADKKENPTHQLIGFKKGQWYDIRLRVTKNHITVWLDDKEIIKQEVPGHKFSLHPAVLKSRPFGICSYSTTAALRKIEMRKLSDKELKEESSKKATDSPK